MEVFEYYKSFEHKISKEKYTRFFLRLAGIAVGYFNRKVCLACEICLSKTNVSYISDKVERIVGSTSNYSELNDSGDQAADSQQQEAEETKPESSTSPYGRKRTRVQELKSPKNSFICLLPYLPDKYENAKSDSSSAEKKQ